MQIMARLCQWMSTLLAFDSICWKVAPVRSQDASIDIISQRFKFLDFGRRLVKNCGLTNQTISAASKSRKPWSRFSNSKAACACTLGFYRTAYVLAGCAGGAWPLTRMVKPVGGLSESPNLWPRINRYSVTKTSPAGISKP